MINLAGTGLGGGTRIFTASVGSWEVIEDFVALSSFTQKTFTIDPPIDFSKVSMIVMEMELISGSGTGNNIVLDVNGVTAGYETYGRTIKAGVEALLDISGANFRIANATLFSDIDDTVHAIIYITLNPTASDHNIGFQCVANGIHQSAQMVVSGSLSSNQTEINELKIQPFSTSLKAGTKVTIYKVSR